MKASYKEFDAIVGLQVVHLMPGQFIFGRRIAAKEMGLTERQIRTILDLLRKAGNLTIKTTSKRPHTRIKELKNKNPEAISNEISLLKNKYNQKLIDSVFHAIALTRKTGKVANSILLAQLKSWERYSIEQVESAIRAYLDKDYAGQGKDEKYLMGIIRNQKPATNPGTTGDPRLKLFTPENEHELYEN